MEQDVRRNGPDIEATLARVAAAHQRLQDLLGGVNDTLVREPSRLPGWTRGHVLAHLADNAWAFERQALASLRGELVDMYDGGQQGRDVSIARKAQASATEIRQSVLSSSAALERLWRTLELDDWDRPIRFRNATVRDTVLARWREAEIHAADLDLNYTSDDWPLDFTMHALDFLAARAPEGQMMVLEAIDVNERWTLGSGPTVTVLSGRIREIVSWMAGRSSGANLRSSTPVLPELKPWPPDPTAVMTER